MYASVSADQEAETPNLFLNAAFALVQMQFVQLGSSGYNATIHCYPLNLIAQLALLLRAPLPAVASHRSFIRCRLTLCEFLMRNPLPVNGTSLLRLLFLHPILFPTSLHLRDTPFQPSPFLHLLLPSLELRALWHVFNPMLRALFGLLNFKVHDFASRSLFDQVPVSAQPSPTDLADGIEGWNGRDAFAAVAGELQTTHPY